MKACSQTSMTSSGLNPAGTPSWCRLTQWLVSRRVIGSSQSNTQPTPRIPPMAWKSVRQASTEPNDSVRARASRDVGSGFGGAPLVRFEK
jgi:hypothetical protein